MSGEDYGSNPKNNQARNIRAIESGKTKNRIHKSATRERIRRLEQRITLLQKEVNEISSRIKTFVKVAKDRKGNTIVVVKNK